MNEREQGNREEIKEKREDSITMKMKNEDKQRREKRCKNGRRKGRKEKGRGKIRRDMTEGREREVSTGDQRGNEGKERRE